MNKDGHARVAQREGTATQSKHPCQGLLEETINGTQFFHANGITFTV